MDNPIKGNHIKTITLEYISAQDNEWRLKKAIELLMGDKARLLQKPVKNSLNFKKEIKNAK